MKLACAQINLTVGDIKGNLEKIKHFIELAKTNHAELIIFPELAISGYPPGELLERAYFIQANLEALRCLEPLSREIGILIGCIQKDSAGDGILLDSAVLLFDGRLSSIHHKSVIPSYASFDQRRFFKPASGIRLARFKGKKLGIVISEDLLLEKIPSKYLLYKLDPIRFLIKEGPEIIINICALPYSFGWRIYKDLLKKIARRCKSSLIFCNQVGGNDELIFEGGSFAVDPNGKIIAQASFFKENLLMIDLKESKRNVKVQELPPLEALYQALILGTRDYVHKCGFKKALVGISGGIDSALTLVIAKEAFGSENVLAVAMPSKFTKRESLQNARMLSQNLGVKLLIVPIHDLYQAYLRKFDRIFPKRRFDITEENIQARIRSNLLMSISNKLGYFVLSTGNRSESLTGYCTLYGDLSGGLSVISDLPKTMVYKLVSQFINREKIVIPPKILQRIPTAELRPAQKDTDALPEYEILDKILKMYIDQRLSPARIIKRGFKAETVRRVINMVEQSEYKRKQAPPGLMLTSDPFHYPRHSPIAKNISLDESRKDI